MKRTFAARCSPSERTRKQASNKAEGSGLYKQIERDNDRNIEDSRTKVDKYKADAEKSINNFEEDGLPEGLAWGAEKTCLKLSAGSGTISPAEKIPDDLSSYVDFPSLVVATAGSWVLGDVLQVRCRPLCQRFQDVRGSSGCFEVWPYLFYGAAFDAKGPTSRFFSLNFQT
jgi:hypothetical protein